jgi:hypothetical protein
MRSRTVPLLSLLVLAFMPAAAQAAPTPAAGHMRVAYDSSPSFLSMSTIAGRNQYVILQPWQLTLKNQLKAANPALKVLAYKNLTFMSASTGGNGISPSGIKFSEADTAHPDWFLHTKANARFTSWSYSWNWAANVGKADYQQRFADNVIAELTQNGWDGVFLDDVNPTIKYHHDPNDVLELPNDTAYAAATQSALQALYPRFRSAGKLMFANNAAWTEYSSVTTPWVDWVDGMMDEMFTKWGNTTGQGYSSESDWTKEVAEIKATEAKAKVFLGVTHSDYSDTQAMRFGWATLLLGANGHSDFQLTHDYTNDSWYPEYDYAIGSPTAAETRDSNGVHRRPYQAGLVLVNPTGSTLSASFGGGTYSGSGLSSASGATMAPHTGLVLTKDGATAPAPTPTPDPGTSTGDTSGGTTSGGTTSGGTTDTSGGTTSGGTTDTSGGTTSGGTTSGGTTGSTKPGTGKGRKPKATSARMAVAQRTRQIVRAHSVCVRRHGYRNARCAHYRRVLAKYRRTHSHLHVRL